MLNQLILSEEKVKLLTLKNIKGKRKDFKHAIVTLEDGQSIDVMGGV